MDCGLIIRKLGALMQNLQALTVFFTIDFGWGCCAPSDFDPTPEIKGVAGEASLLAGAETPTAALLGSSPT